MNSRWVFTLNNYTEAEVGVLRAFAETDACRYMIFGREVGENGTAHLQGFVVFARSQRLSFCRRNLSGRAHYEGARGTSVQAAEYCKKDGSFEEIGELPREQGRRTDLEQFFEWGDTFIVANGRPPTSPEIAQAFPREFLKFPRASRLFAHRAPPPTIREGEPNEWQSELAEELSAEADDRSVVFYVDEEGGKGKTWFQQWMLTTKPGEVQVLSVGKRDDLTYAIDPSKRCFLFNIPRGGMEFLQYTVLEMLKDQMVFSTKYQSSMKVLRTKVHVVVFCNEPPDDTKMSADRYIVRSL